MTGSRSRMSAKLRKENCDNAARFCAVSWPRAIKRSGSANGSGLSNTVLTTLKMAVFAPMPSARVRMAMALYARLLPQHARAVAHVPPENLQEHAHTPRDRSVPAR